MDTNFSVEDESFRSSVRVFLKENLPARLAAKVRDGQPLTKNDQEEWHAMVAVDAAGKPAAIAKLEPQSTEEKRRYSAALDRRRQRDELQKQQ